MKKFQIILNILLFVLSIIFSGCNSSSTGPENGILEIIVSDQSNFDHVHCIIVKDSTIVWENDLIEEGIYFTEQVSLNSGNDYSAEIRCYVEHQMVFEAYHTGITIQNGETNTVLISPSVTIPLIPDNFIAISVSSIQINLEWSDNSFNEEGFLIERKTSEEEFFTQLVDLPLNITNYEDTNLEEGKSYYYRISSYNSAGESECSNIVTAFTYKIVGSLNIVSSCNDIVIYDNYAYIGSGSDLYIVDISDPTNPYEIGFTENGGKYIVTSGNYLYTCYSDHLRILDITDPIDPILISSTYFYGVSTDIDIFENHVFIASNYYGDPDLLVYDVTNTEAPTQICTFEIEGGCTGLTYYNDLVYLHSKSRRLKPLG